MTKPSARDYFLREYMPRFFSSRTYEEYLLETTRRLGRLKGELPKEMVEYYANHPLDTLKFSNSIELNFVCEGIVETVPGIQDFLDTCFFAVTPETLINASAYYRDRAHSGHIIEVNAGIMNWFTFFLAPFVTLSWFLDNDTSQRDKTSYAELFEKQKADLAYLKGNNVEFRDINKLELPWFPNEDMWLEYTYYKNAAYSFVALHEVGHHALKHTTGTCSELFDADLSEYVSTSDNNDHKLEFEADYFALRNVLASATKRGARAEDKVSVEINSLQIGPVLALLGLSYLSDSFDEDSDTHPSLKKRLDACLEFYLANFGSYGLEYGMHITRAYSISLFGENSSITRAWDAWWQKITA